MCVHACVYMRERESNKRGRDSAIIQEFLFTYFHFGVFEINVCKDCDIKSLPRLRGFLKW